MKNKKQSFVVPVFLYRWRDQQYANDSKFKFLITTRDTFYFVFVSFALLFFASIGVLGFGYEDIQKQMFVVSFLSFFFYQSTSQMYVRETRLERKLQKKKENHTKFLKTLCYN
ncbi:MAG: hypothetical protein WC059_03745 [Candidatus Paceibacterota bacterium]